MASFVQAKLTGDMLSGLDKLVAAAGESALRATGVAGARVFQEEAIRRVPVDTGTIKRNIIIKRAEEKSSGAEKQTYLVTVRTGKHGNEGDAYYWRFVEGGHKIVPRKPENVTWKVHREAMALEYGSSRVPAKPFIRPAFESMKRAAVEAMKARLREKLKEGA